MAEETLNRNLVGMENAGQILADSTIHVLYSNDQPFIGANQYSAPSYVTHLAHTDKTMLVGTWRLRTTGGRKECFINILRIFNRLENQALARQATREDHWILLFYNVASRSSFWRLHSLKAQVDMISGMGEFNADSSNKSLPVLVVAYTTDDGGERSVTTAEGMELAKEFGFPFIEGSMLGSTSCCPCLVDLSPKRSSAHAEHSGPEGTVTELRPEDGGGSFSLPTGRAEKSTLLRGEEFPAFATFASGAWGVWGMLPVGGGEMDAAGTGRIIAGVSTNPHYMHAGIFNGQAHDFSTAHNPYRDGLRASLRLELEGKPAFEQSMAALGSLKLSDSQVMDDRPNVEFTHTRYEKNADVPYLSVGYLGSGTHGYVEEVKPTSGKHGSTERFVRKVVRVPAITSAPTLELLQNEVDIIKRLRHHHIVRVIASYDAPSKFGIIMTPVAETNLDQYLVENPRPDDQSKICRWFGCLTAALAYLYAQKVKHYDIKPANIIIKGKQIFFTDFGIAKDKLGESTTSSSGGYCPKTPLYCAPEVADSLGSRGRSADVFPLGCVFLEMFTALMWRWGVSLEALHAYKVTDDKHSYCENREKVLRWLLCLFALRFNTKLQDRMELTNIWALQWCFAMLQPDQKNRIKAPALNRWVHLVESLHVSNLAQRGLLQEEPEANCLWSGYCCRSTRAEPPVSSDFGGLSVWPSFDADETLDMTTALSWELANKELGYKVPVWSPMDTPPSDNPQGTLAEP